MLCRTIEIRGDQTLAQLHGAIFKAFDRFDEHMYEFQFGESPLQYIDWDEEDEEDEEDAEEG